jgi:hypothetical protein
MSSPNKTAATKVEYLTLSHINENFRSNLEKFEKVNLYGVITFIGQPKFLQSGGN